MPIAGLEQRRTYYYAATAYTKDGWESDFSNEVSYSTKDSVSLTEVIVDTGDPGSSSTGRWYVSSGEVCLCSIGRYYERILQFPFCQLRELDSLWEASLISFSLQDETPDGSSQVVSRSNIQKRFIRNVHSLYSQAIINCCLD